MYRVMIADDEPVVRKALQVLINWESIDCQVVYVANDGQEVIDNIQNASPDIIVTDIKMPVVDGLSIAKYIKEQSLPIKVILLTAYADFSYAKTALQYGVVDYVTKVGAFDGLMKALESAKEQLQDERKAVGMENQAAVIENFFKSLIDGSVYDREEIFSKAEQYGLPLRQFMLLAFRFRMDANLNRERKEKIHNSLLNFFEMLFQRQKIYIISVRRNLLCVLLDGVSGSNVKDVKTCCDEATDIIKNFMKLDVHIGGSRITADLQGLRQAYNEANVAINQSFYSRESKLCFYEPELERHGQNTREGQALIDEICHFIQKGDRDNALRSFEQLFRVQLQEQVAVEAIKSSGVYIENCCRRYLAEYNTTVEEVLETDRDISQLIYDSFQIEEFHTILVELIGRVSGYIDHSANRKNVFIHECEQIIKENLGRNISVTEIAARLGVSGSYLSRIFKDKTGGTVINAINQAKLEAAKDLLKNTDMKIYEIADRLGFENITYFSHFFKKHTRISPNEYKKKFEIDAKEE